MGLRFCTATGASLLLIGLVGFLWPRWDGRRSLAATLMVHGVALCSVGGLQGDSGDGRAMALVVLGLLPVGYLMAALLARREERR
jgi:hypothetical protein